MRFVVTEAGDQRWTWRLYWHDATVAQAPHEYASERLAREAADVFARQVEAADRLQRRR